MKKTYFLALSRPPNNVLLTVTRIVCRIGTEMETNAVPKSTEHQSGAWWRDLSIPPAAVVWGALLAVLGWLALETFEMNGRLARLEEAVKNNGKSLDRIDKSLDRIENYLLEGNR